MIRWIIRFFVLPVYWKTFAHLPKPIQTLLIVLWIPIVFCVYLAGIILFWFAAFYFMCGVYMILAGGIMFIVNFPSPNYIIFQLKQGIAPWGYWHPLLHLLFEGLGYVASWWVFRHQTMPDVLSPESRKALKWWTLGGAVLGAKLVPLLELWHTPLWWVTLISGKSLAGGLLGGIIGSEVRKRRLGIAASTGDVLVLPLLVGTCIGRIGCSSTAMWDGMLGIPVQHETAQALLVYFGAWGKAFLTVQVSEAHRGASLFPIQQATGLYWNTASWELLGLLVIAGILLVIRPWMARQFKPGAWFYAFCVPYSLLRFGLEVLKQGEGALSVVQGVSLLMLIISLYTLWWLYQRPFPPTSPDERASQTRVAD
jgi:hypothetical protein